MNAIILGRGRIASAIVYYFKRLHIPGSVSFFSNERGITKADLLIGALPGGLGEKSLQLALKYRKNLIDLADLDTDFYLRHKKHIEQAGITVIPGCGFCPGLVNFILGREISRQKKISGIEVMAGSLSPQKFYFPFLWCFEDLVLEFMLSSWQMVRGRKRKFPPFGGYREEKFFGIEAESYLGQSGFENLAAAVTIPDFTYRNVRPAGFMLFFRFLHTHGLFDRKNPVLIKNMLEERKKDNLSLSQIKITASDGERVWLIKSFSGKNERLNSMQKITALFTVAVISFLRRATIREKGLVFCEKLGEDRVLFRDGISWMRENGMYIRNYVIRKRKILVNNSL